MNERFPTTPEEEPVNSELTPEEDGSGAKTEQSRSERGPEVGPEELKEVVKTAAEARVFIEQLQDTYNEFHIIAGDEAIAVRNASELTDALFEEIKKEADSVLVRVPIE